METENNKHLYKFSEKGIKTRNDKLWSDIINYTNLNIKFKEKFYLYENSLSNIPKCVCGNDLKFIDMVNGYREFCCRECMYNSDEVKKRKIITNMERYGVDNPSKLEIIKDKVKKTNNGKFGVDYPLQSIDIINKSKGIFASKYGVDNPSKIKEIRHKAENTMLMKYGVRHAMQSESIKNNLKLFFIEKYGVDNPSKINGIREKAEDTMMEKYGVRHALQNADILNKMKNTNIDRYGVEYTFQSKEISDNIKNILLNKYGVEFISQNKDIKNKIFKTNIERYGVYNFSCSDNFKQIMNKIKIDRNRKIVNNHGHIFLNMSKSEYEIICKDCGSIFKIQRQLWRNRIKNNETICLCCNPINNGISRSEKEVLAYIKSIYNDDIIENYRICGREIDIYLPNMKIGFEYNGLYWHSELFKSKFYHYDKMRFINDLGIKLIQIWEDEWSHKNHIVKSIILNELGLSKKINSDECKVTEISDSKIIKKFLNENNIYGFTKSKIKIGMYYNNELVSLMIFRKLKYDENFELIRFSDKIGISVVGGTSKLFNYFLNNYKINKLVAYSLNNYSDGDLYSKLGFKLIENIKPNNFWCKSGIKYNKHYFNKEKFDEMYEKGYFRLFDCGSKKWIYG